MRSKIIILLFCFVALARAQSTVTANETLLFIAEAQTILESGYCDPTLIVPSVAADCFSALNECLESRPILIPLCSLSSDLFTCRYLSYYCPCNNVTDIQADQQNMLDTCQHNTAHCQNYCSYLPDPVLIPDGYNGTYQDLCAANSNSTLYPYMCDATWWNQTGCPFPYDCSITAHNYLLSLLTNQQVYIYIGFCDQSLPDVWSYVQCFDSTNPPNNNQELLGFFAGDPFINITAGPPEDVFYIYISPSSYMGMPGQFIPSFEYFSCLKNMQLFGIVGFVNWTSELTTKISAAPNLTDYFFYQVDFIDNIYENLDAVKTKAKAFSCYGCTQYTVGEIDLDQFNITNLVSFTLQGYQNAQAITTAKFFSRAYPKLQALNLPGNFFTRIVDISDLNSTSVPNLLVYNMQDNLNVIGSLDTAFCNIPICQFQNTRVCTSVVDGCCSAPYVCCPALRQYTSRHSCFNETDPISVSAKCDQSYWYNDFQNCFNSTTCTQSYHTNILYRLAECANGACDVLGGWDPNVNSDYCNSTTIGCIKTYEPFLVDAMTHVPVVYGSTILTSLNSSFNSYLDDIAAYTHSVKVFNNNGLGLNLECLKNLRILNIFGNNQTLSLKVSDFIVSSFYSAKNVNFLHIDTAQLNVESFQYFTNLKVLVLENSIQNDQVGLLSIPDSLISLTLRNVLQNNVTAMDGHSEPLDFTQVRYFGNANLESIVLDLQLAEVWDFAPAFTGTNIQQTLKFANISISTGLSGVIPDWMCGIQSCFIQRVNGMPTSSHPNCCL